VTKAAARSAHAARWFATARGAYGAALLCAPGPLTSAAAGRPASTGVRATARVLGARQLLQAAVTGAGASPAVLALGAATDLVHAASMLGLALAGRRWRRAALLDAVLATALAAAGAVAAEGGTR